MIESKHREIADDIIDNLYWLTNTGGFASPTLEIKTVNHFYKVTNSDKEHESLNTVADYLIESVDDAIHIIYFAEEEKITRESIRKEIVNEIVDESKPIFLLLKLQK